MEKARYSEKYGADVLHDHSDHVSTARFATKAVGTAAGARRIVAYRNYNLTEVQYNLEHAERELKYEVFFSYYRPQDRFTGDTAWYTKFTERQYHRFSTGTRWVDRNLDGRLQAFAVFNDKVRTWWQQPGGAWASGYLASPGGPLAPTLSISRDRSGLLHVYALRISDWQIITISQREVNGGWHAGWTSLGTPNPAAPGRFQLGQPAVTTNKDGRIQVFVKNGGGGISTIRETFEGEPSGDVPGWTPWESITPGIDGIQDGLAVTTNGEGRIELFALAAALTGPSAGKAYIHHLYQPTENSKGFNTNLNFAAFEPSSPPTVATNKDGRLDVFYRLATNSSGAHAGKVAHTWQTEAGGGWITTPQILNGHGGVGPVAAGNAPHSRDGVAAIEDARIMLFQRNRGGGISTTRQVAVDSGYVAAWEDQGNYVATDPAVISDRDGRMFALAVAGDGTLLVNYQWADPEKGPRGGSPFEGWRRVG